MIYEHGGLALNLFNIKAVKKEVTGREGRLVFEFHNMIRSVEREAGRDVWEDYSYENASVIQHFDNLADLELHYEEWVNLWMGFTAYVINLDLPIDFKPNRI